jgi:hypothetical protein
MVEILRPTAIGRLEELGVTQDSSGVSIGECGAINGTMIYEMFKELLYCQLDVR